MRYTVGKRESQLWRVNNVVPGGGGKSLIGKEGVPLEP